MSGRYKSVSLAVLILGLALLGACDGGTPADGEDQVQFVATVHPLTALLEELVDGRGKVTCLLAAGSSPHVYSPRPSDIRASASARAVFYVDEQIDGWATDLPAQTKIAVFGLVPEEERLSWHETGGVPCVDHDHGHGESGHGEHALFQFDAHFWMSPKSVAATVPALVSKLVELDPAGRDIYEQNGAALEAELAQLDKRLESMLAGVEGEKVILYHPSVLYLLKRYGIVYAGAIEPFPGKEATPNYLRSQVELVEREGIKALFTEPQLSPKAAHSVAEAAGIPVYILDPIGGVDGRKSYEELLMYNADQLLKALE